MFGCNWRQHGDAPQRNGKPCLCQGWPFCCIAVSSLETAAKDLWLGILPPSWVSIGEHSAVVRLQAGARPDRMFKGLNHSQTIKNYKSLTNNKDRKKQRGEKPTIFGPELHSLLIIYVIQNCIFCFLSYFGPLSAKKWKSQGWTVFHMQLTKQAPNSVLRCCSLGTMQITAVGTLLDGASFMRSYSSKFQNCRHQHTYSSKPW